MSYNFRHRFTEETVDADANIKKQVKADIPVASKRYAQELMDEVDAGRETHGKRPFEEDEPPGPLKKKRDNTSKKKQARRKREAKKHKTVQNVTAPDSGLFVKGEHKRQFAYEAHTACDDNGFVLETVVTAGNVHDSVALDDVYEKVTRSFPEVETVVADSAYKTPHICKKVFEDVRVLSTAYKRPQTMKGGHEWWKYVYDEYREYKSNPQVCENGTAAYLEGL